MILSVGCTKEAKPAPEYPERLPITEQAKELTELPAYQPPTDGGQTAGLSLDDPAPFDGVLLSEDLALKAGELRINYDEVYRLALADRKYMLSVIEIQEKQLYRADAIIDQKEAQLREIRDDWWQKNKLQVGIVVGLVAGVGLSLATGAIWAKIEEGQSGP
jgi:hypothetical protein